MTSPSPDHPPDRLRVFVGFGADEMVACKIAMDSMRRWTDSRRLDLQRLSRLSLQPHYTRPTTTTDEGHLWDSISQAPMSTDHAIARFFIPWLCDYAGWALFTDGDVLCRRSLHGLFALADDRYAVMCVQHPPLLDTGRKKDGAIQISYQRKNWSSVMLLYCGHPSNRTLDLNTVNTWPGRDLHAFRWLADCEIGALPPEWNYLVNLSPPVDHPDGPALVHYTEGLPSLPDHADDPYALEWFAQAKQCGYVST